MERFDPLGIGTTTGRPDIFTGELRPGYEVTLLRKGAIERRHRELYGNESAFLERATRKGIVGVPRLFAYKADRALPQIEMEHIQGQQYYNYNSFRTDDGVLKYPDDIEVQIKAFPLYIRTMDNVIRNTGMVKPKDNKALDAIIVNRALNAFGDLVIIDWGFVEPVTSYNRNLFLSDGGKYFMIFPPSSTHPGQYRGISFHDIDSYLCGQNRAQELRTDPSLKDNSQYRAAQIRKATGEAQIAGDQIKQWLEHAPETPYKLLCQQLFRNEYDPQQFVNSLVEYYSWLDSPEVMTPQERSWLGIPQSITPEERVRREAAYHEVISWIGTRWLEGGVDLAQAQPWIRHLDEQAKSSLVTARSYSEHLSLSEPIERRRPPRTVGIPERGVPEGYISFAEAAREGHMAPTSLYILVMEGQVPCVNAKGHFFVNRSSISRSTQDN